VSGTSLPADGLAAETAVAEAPGFLRRLLHRKLAVACIAYLVVVVIVALVAPIVFPHVSGEQAGNLAEVRQTPSSAHPLGTDTLGRDILQRLLVGTRATMVGVAEALAVVLLLGVPFGLAAGYFGGRVDRAVTWVAEIALSIPAVVVLVMVLSVFRYSMLAAMMAFGILISPLLMRVVRAAVLPVRQELYIAAARVSGLSHGYVIRRHVLPRVAGPIVIQASLLAALALLVQSGLAFLGLLVKEPAPSWGGMVTNGLSVLVLQPWLIWPPGIAISLTVLAFGLLGDAVRDSMVEGWAAPIRRIRNRAPSVNGAALPSPESGALLSIRGLKVAFRSPDGSDVRVVDDVSFDIRPRETVGVVGESGCGKSATAMSILGLLPSGGCIQEGTILFDGRDLTRMRDRDLHRIRGREIGLISQEPMVAFDPTFRVGWQLAEVVRRHHSLSRAQARQRVLELLEKVKLPDPELVARRYPHELSGGMAQRIAIARALAGNPRLLIADEPTTALDVTVQAEILELLRELQEQNGMAIMLITHDWGVVADICDRTVVLYAGQVVERAPLIPIFREPLHPYTEALLAANPHGGHAAEDLPTIPGSVPQPGHWPSGCHFHLRCSYATAACVERPIPLEHIDDARETRCIHADQLRVHV
jgi:peptide/nickel transport system permease protein